MIDIERVSTWPKSIVEILTDSLENLRNYERVRRGIDTAVQKDALHLYSRQPQNPFSQQRAAVLQRINELIVDDDLLGFHCTRLHPDDITSIKRDGLQPLSSAKLHSRIEERMSAGDIPSRLGKSLLADHQANKDYRKGRIYFVNSRSILADDFQDVCRLFRYWGGESLYQFHQSHPGISPLLRSIGVPCIVVAHLPIQRFQTTCNNIGDKIIWSFLNKKRIKTEHSPKLQGYMKEVVPPARIREIIVHRGQRFESLTHCNSWPSFASLDADTKQIEKS